MYVSIMWAFVVWGGGGLNYFELVDLCGSHRHASWSSVLNLHISLKAVNVCVSINAWGKSSGIELLLC
jgi:hypothetical protein